MAREVAPVERLVLLNQMAGPLFRELAEDLAVSMPQGCLLHTGHPDTLAMKETVPAKLVVQEAPGYDRSSLPARFISWTRYLFSCSNLIIKAKPGDRFLLVSNPPILGLWFMLMNSYRRTPYAVLVYDIYPDVLINMGVLSASNPAVGIWNWIHRKLYRKAKLVVTLGEYMAKKVEAQYAANPGEVKFIPPWADTENISPLATDKNPCAKEFNPEGRTVILYSGNMGISHNIDSILEAVKILSHRSDLLFLFIGNGAKWQDAVDFKGENELDNMAVYPFQPESKLPYTMALATVSLVALDEGAEGLMIPSKLFYYLSSGACVLGVCNHQNELRDIIESNGCGACVEPRNPNALAETLLDLVDNPERLNRFRERAREVAVSDFSRQNCTANFLSELKAIGFAP